jgi:hypothetical protein
MADGSAAQASRHLPMPSRAVRTWGRRRHVIAPGLHRRELGGPPAHRPAGFAPAASRRQLGRSGPCHPTRHTEHFRVGHGVTNEAPPHDHWRLHRLWRRILDGHRPRLGRRRGRRHVLPIRRRIRRIPSVQGRVWIPRIRRGVGDRAELQGRLSPGRRHTHTPSFARGLPAPGHRLSGALRRPRRPPRPPGFAPPVWPWSRPHRPP